MSTGGDHGHRAYHQWQVSALLYLDDLRVGQQFDSQSHAVDEEQIIRFAREFDPQTFHIDRAAAKRTLYGRPH